MSKSFLTVPGVGGNQLLAKLNKPSTVHWICDSNTDDFFTLWLNPFSVVAPFLSDCWVDNMRLVYNPQTHRSENMPGVVTSVGGLMQTETMEWVDSNFLTRNYDFGAYYTYIVDTLVMNGFERLKSLFGAPYDFRRGPSKIQHYASRI